MDDALTTLGANLRKLRKAHRMTLAELASASHLSAGLLSRIENARTSPSLGVIYALAEVLQCTPGELFDAPDNRSGKHGKYWFFVGAQELQLIERESNTGFEYRLVFESRLDAARVQAMLVTIRPGAKREPVTGEGVESLYVLAGHTDYHVGDDVIPLAPGDTLFFDSRIPHGPEAPVGESLVTLTHYYLRENIFGD